jgi:hypothetical protein
MSVLLAMALAAASDGRTFVEDPSWPRFDTEAYCQSLVQSKREATYRKSENCQTRENQLRQVAESEWLKAEGWQKSDCLAMAESAVGSYTVLWQCLVQAKLFNSVKAPIDPSKKEVDRRLAEIEKREHALGLAPPCLNQYRKDNCPPQGRVWLYEKLGENEEFTVDGKIRKINPEIVAASNSYNDMEGKFPTFDSDAHCEAISVSSDPKVYKTLDYCKWLESSFLPETKEYWEQMDIKQKNFCLTSARGGGGSYFVLYTCAALTLGIEGA